MTAAAAILTGCGGDDEVSPTVEPATEVPPTDTAIPTDTAVPSTDTPVATDTPVPPTDTPEPTDTPTPTPTPIPEVTVNQASVNIRQGPGVAHPVALIGYEGDTFPVTGRIQGGTWFEITLDGGLIGWIAASVVTFIFPVDNIPLALVIPTAPPLVTEAPPTNTPAPIPTGISGTVPEGQTGINYTIDGREFTLPCGSPIPPGATCVCNCVTVPLPPPPPSSGGGEICTCDLVTYWYPN